MKKLLLALQFLTIIPVKVKGQVSEDEISGAVVFSPVVGAFQGVLIAFSALFLIKIFSPEITSALIVLILTLSNGGFHLDGLADSFDALAVKSSGDRAADIRKRLSVMKDSYIGSIGVISITLIVLLKFLFIKDLFSMNVSMPVVASLLFLMPVFSRWAMIPAMYHGTSARGDGLGKMFIDNCGINTVAFSSLLTVAFYVLAAVFILRRPYGTGAITLFFVLSSVLYAFSFLSAKFCEGKFDGLTGDTLGAISEISEIIFLAGVSLWLRRSF